MCNGIYAKRCPTRLRFVRSMQQQDNKQQLHVTARLDKPLTLADSLMVVGKTKLLPHVSIHTHLYGGIYGDKNGKG